LISGIQVKLLLNGQTISTQFTDGNGFFNFTAPYYGNYSIQALLPNSSWIFSPSVSSGSDVTTVSGLNGVTYNIASGTLPSFYDFFIGMLELDTLVFSSPSNGDSCLSGTSGSTLGLGEIVNLYPRVLLVEPTPSPTLTVTLNDNMEILNASLAFIGVR
jgi:hypothetical protein